MKNSMALLQKPVLPDQTVKAPDDSGYSLNIAGVYQDSVTRDWALQTCRRATLLAGEDRIQNTWFLVHSLHDPETLLDAVQAALAADVIVVAVHAAHQLPLELYVWIDAWLPRRPARMGALAAVIGVAETPGPPSVRTLLFLQAVAAKARLDFFSKECRQPAALPASSVQLIAERAGVSPPAWREISDEPCEGYAHEGLNE